MSWTPEDEAIIAQCIAMIGNGREEAIAQCNAAIKARDGAIEECQAVIRERDEAWKKADVSKQILEKQEILISQNERIADALERLADTAGRIAEILLDKEGG